MCLSYLEVIIYIYIYFFLGIEIQVSSWVSELVPNI
jgi:hypothetical protein